jgi:hypothetical protein
MPSQLVGAIPGTAAYDPTFPERVFIGERDPAVVSARVLRLGKWLSAVMRMPAVRKHPTLNAFLGSDARAHLMVVGGGDAATQQRLEEYDRAVAAAAAAVAAESTGAGGRSLTPDRRREPTFGGISRTNSSPSLGRGARSTGDLSYGTAPRKGSEASSTRGSDADSLLSDEPHRGGDITVLPHVELGVDFETLPPVPEEKEECGATGAAAAAAVPGSAVNVCGLSATVQKTERRSQSGGGGGGGGGAISTGAVEGGTIAAAAAGAAATAAATAAAAVASELLGDDSHATRGGVRPEAEEKVERPQEGGCVAAAAVLFVDSTRTIPVEALPVAEEEKSVPSPKRGGGTAAAPPVTGAIIETTTTTAAAAAAAAAVATGVPRGDNSHATLEADVARLRSELAKAEATLAAAAAAVELDAARRHGAASAAAAPKPKPAQTPPPRAQLVEASETEIPHAPRFDIIAAASAPSAKRLLMIAAVAAALVTATIFAMRGR